MANVELIFTADFSSPWATAAEEVDAMDSDDWEPSLVDFEAVAKADKKAHSDIELVDNIKTFLGPIQSAADGSVERINVITHANPNLIALSGAVKKDGTVSLNISGGFSKPVAGGIDLDALAGLRKSSPMTLKQ